MAGVTLAVAWLGLLMVAAGPETCDQANVSGPGPPSGSLPLPLRVTRAPVATDWSGPAFAVGGRFPPPPKPPFASSARYAAASLENFSAWFALLPLCASVSFAVWMDGL